MSNKKHGLSYSVVSLQQELLRHALCERNHCPEWFVEPQYLGVVDQGTSYLGTPSHATEAMEMGYDAILLNTAIAKAGDPAKMAQAFARAVEAGRLAFEAGPIEPRDMAQPSTPVAGTPFFQIDHAS